MTADGVDRSMGAPRFDVVLRGYDRRQVDEHVARLQRVLARMRADLDVARSQPMQAVQPTTGGLTVPGAPTPPGSTRAPRPAPRPRPGPPRPAGQSPDVIDNFTDRMQSILQAAEEEADEIRNQARSAARADEQGLRAELAELIQQRAAVLADLTRLRGQLESMLSGPTARMMAPARDTAPGGPDGPAQPVPPQQDAPLPGGPARPSPRPSPGRARETGPA
ncbi:hypothetical protein HF519_03755, partial [Pseudonocardia bannensis]|nr:hypothetical protein [Pseudonocardia bannensis]